MGEYSIFMAEGVYRKQRIRGTGSSLNQSARNGGIHRYGRPTRYRNSPPILSWRQENSSLGSAISSPTRDWRSTTFSIPAVTSQEESDAFGDQIILLPTGAGKIPLFPASRTPSSRSDTCCIPPPVPHGRSAPQIERSESAGGDPQRGTVRGGTGIPLRSLKNGETKILLSNPESLSNPRTLEALVPLSITHFVVDEAHCIAQWGETFRPAYLNLGKIRTTLKPTVTTAFTATASPFVLEKIREHLFKGFYPHEVSANPDRPNIQYSVIETLSKQRTLRTLFSSTSEKERVQRPALVFCRSRKRTEQLALNPKAFLTRKGNLLLPCRSFARRKKEDREMVFPELHGNPRGYHRLWDGSGQTQHTVGDPRRSAGNGRSLPAGIRSGWQGYPTLPGHSPCIGRGSM
jgi:hypothetical protein